MQKFQAKLLWLVKHKIITKKDVALIILAKDGLKPLSSVGVSSSQELIEVLKEYNINFVIRDGRIYLGKLANVNNCLDGHTYGFPSCCCSSYTKHVPHFRKPHSSSKSSFVFHIPCCKECRPTQQLALRYQYHIRQHYPVASQFLNNGFV